MFVSKQRGTLSEPDSLLALPLYHNRQRRPPVTSITGRWKQQVCSSELLGLQQVNAEALGRSLLLFSLSKMRIPREKHGLGVFMVQKHQTLTLLWELRGKRGTQLAQKQATSDPSLNTPKGWALFILAQISLELLQKQTNVCFREELWWYEKANRKTGEHKAGVELTANRYLRGTTWPSSAPHVTFITPVKGHRCIRPRWVIQNQRHQNHTYITTSRNKHQSLKTSSSTETRFLGI